MNRRARRPGNRPGRSPRPILRSTTGGRPGLRPAAALLILALFPTPGCSPGSEEAASGDTSFVVLSQPASAAGHDTPAKPSPEIWQTPLADPELERGRRVWKGTCIDCHSTGLGGAPLIGNRSLWAPRIEQGLDVLVEHATTGFYGDVGEMPPRGGNPTLDDDEIRASVRFMASRVDASI